MRESRRMSQVQAPIIPIIGSLVREHPGTISLGQGIVHYGPPPEALEAAAHWQQAASASGSVLHKYAPVQGTPELVAALQAKLRTENGIDVSPKQIIVTAG